MQTGYWPLYRYNPALLAEGKNPLLLDSKEPTLPLDRYIYNETRYRMLVQSNEERAGHLLQFAQSDVQERLRQYHRLEAE
ncbi:MAG: hypothetical protein H0U76_30280 [Ktedonobacteraceae bacterium]|nr:hypothetical protein [Ktedonobacteraceae bacterium]